MPAISRDGGIIHYERDGHGAPLVMLHGGLVDSRAWAPQRELAKSLTLVLPDMRNAGKSLGFDGPVAMDQLLEDIRAVAVDAGLETFHLLGFSMGSLIAQAFALRHTTLVRSLILAGATLRGLPVLPARQNVTHVERAFSPRFREQHADFIQTYSQMAAANEASGYGRTREVWAEAPDAAAIEGLRTPTLVLHSVDDASLPIANAELIASIMPNAELRRFENVGHTVQTEAPSEFNAAVLEFVESIESTPVAT